MVKKNMFSSGFDRVKSEVDRQEKAREASSKRVNKFFLKKDGDEAEVLFLNEEPVNYQAHTLPQNTAGGKTFYQDFLCSGAKDCEYCAEGKPSFKSAFLIIDNTPYTSKDNKVVPQTLKLYTVGTRISTQLSRLSSKYGLVGRMYTIARNGSGTATTYAIDRGDKMKIGNVQVKALLPEDFREEFDGTEESVHTIIEQLLTLEDEMNRGLTSDDEDDDDDDVDDGVLKAEEEEEEDEEPKKVSKFKKLTTTRQTSRTTSVIKKK